MPSTATGILEGMPDPVRKLALLLYALRHEYLGRHVYSAAEKVEPMLLQKVRTIVSSVSTLLKAKSKMSPWAVLLGEDRHLLLLLDEANGIAMEELAACLTEFNLAIAGGDENQVAIDQKQDAKEETHAEELREETSEESRAERVVNRFR